MNAIINTLPGLEQLIFISIPYARKHELLHVDKCTKDENGNEHCFQDDEDEPCFYEEQEETLFQWDPVERGYERQLELEEGKIHTLRTVAVKPKLFEILNFLTDEECDHIIEIATTQGLHASGLFFDKHALASKNYTHGHSRFVVGDFDRWDIDEDGEITIEDTLNFANEMGDEGANSKAYCRSLSCGEETILPGTQYGIE
eukprot:gene1260-15641_t